MTKRTKRIIVTMIMTAVMLFSVTAGVFADVPYRSYVQSAWMVDAASPESYVPVGWFNATTMGMDTPFLEPDDMQIAENGDIYILDTKNNRVVIARYDEALEKYVLHQEIKEFYWANMDTYMKPPIILATPTPVPEEGEGGETAGEATEGETTEVAEQPVTDDTVADPDVGDKVEPADDGIATEPQPLDDTTEAPAADDTTETPADETPAEETPAEETPEVVDERVMTPLKEPIGIYVKGEYIYIADTGNNRVIKVKHTGEIVTAYYKPDAKAYTAESYVPKKIVVDNNDMVYVVADSVYQGAILFNPDGSFNSFYGSANVEVTIQVLTDRFWKKILNKEQKSVLARYVPVEYDNMDIDPKGFVYTCTDFSKTNMAQLRKLNPLGKNIYPMGGSMNFGDSQIIFYKQESLTTRFVEVCADEDEFMYGLDQGRDRIYVFDQDCDTLMTFGTGNGAQFGTLDKPTGMDTYGNQVFVLDAMQGRVTIYEPSEYGQAIRDAIVLFNAGEYEQAMEPWQKVLALNCNYELAYFGMGQAMLKTENYEKAVEYFRKAYAQGQESIAFGKLRDKVIRANFGWIIIIVLIVMVALLLFTSKNFLLKIKRAKTNRKKG